ncbi:DUF2971 domain-containing protein [Aurantiacibacter gilvus]|uniref:DUF2971 domain-containing protein n=1 Tax=Aurantiacibacter gilvus TaxID=3139141 RepID=A0ABU9ICK8_9SPHN
MMTLYPSDYPATIFKYRALSGEYGRDAIENAVLHHRLYWQSPLAFNDPLDCNPVYYFGDNPKERREYIKGAVGRHLKGVPRHFRTKRRREILTTDPEVFARRQKDSWQEFMIESAVTCFSQTSTNELMWAHYADSHRGVCLEFDNSEIGEGWCPFPVRYSEERPRINLTNINETETFQQSVLLKSDAWAYEQEYRLIEWRRPPGWREFDESRLKAIILGARVNEDDRNFVRDLVARKTNIVLREIQIDEGHFRLNVVDLDSTT